MKDDHEPHGHVSISRPAAPVPLLTSFPSIGAASEGSVQDITYLTIVIVCLAVVIAFLELILWLTVSRVVKMARGYWPLPRTAWVTLRIGFFLLAGGSGLLAIAVFLLQSQLAREVTEPAGIALTVGGFVCLGAGTITLIAWLGYTLRRSYASRWEQMRHSAAHIRTRMRLTVALVLAVITAAGVAVEIAEVLRSWQAGAIVGIPLGVVCLCLAVLIAHA